MKGLPVIPLAAVLAILLRFLLYPASPLGIAPAVLGPVLGLGLARSIQSSLSVSLGRYAARLGLAGLVKKGALEIAEELGASVALGVAVPAAMIATAVLLNLLLGEPLLPAAAASMVAAVPSVASLMSYSDKPRERRSRTDSEMPFFTTYLTIMASCGLTVYNAMRQVRGVPRIFEHISREVEQVERLIAYFGKGTLEAIETHAASHPHDLYQSTLLQAASIQRTGGNVVTALEDKMKESLKRLEDAFTRYSDLVLMMGESAVILLFILPISAALVAILNPDLAVGIMLMLLVLVVPIMGVVLYMSVKASSPAKYDTYSLGTGTVMLSLVIGAASAAASKLLGLPLPVAFSAGGLAASLLLYRHMRPQILEVEQSERELRRFLRDVAELRRVGHPITKALDALRRQSYRERFKDLLNRVAVRTQIGLAMWQAAADARSWLARMTFFLLHIIEVSGGGSPALVERYADTLRGYEVARGSARGRMRIFIYMALAGPLLGGVTLALVMPLTEMWSGVGEMVASAGAAGFSFTAPTKEQIAQMTDYAMLLIASTTALLIVVLGRAVDMHPFGLHRLAIAFALTIATYYALPYMTGIIKGVLIPTEISRMIGG